MKSKSEPVSTNEKRRVTKSNEIMKKINSNLQAIKEIQFCNVKIATNNH